MALVAAAVGVLLAILGPPGLLVWLHPPRGFNPLATWRDMPRRRACAFWKLETKGLAK